MDLTIETRSPDERYFVKPRDVVSELVDDEVIVISLKRGHYFSLTGAAAFIWSRLMAGDSTREIAEAATNGDPAADGDEVGERVARLVAELVAEGLVSPQGDDPTQATTPPARAASLSMQAGPFNSPRIEKFTDMQEYLLVDPVHEVDDPGWPHTKPG